MAASDKSSRAYDVIVWGATGFTGRLVAEYLARTYGVGEGLRWAIAGRSKDKLAATRDALRGIKPAARDLPILLGDGNDRASLDVIAAQTRVIATTVGPYAVHGRELVAACAAEGTDSCDLTGEPQFVLETVRLHAARARETGARIVNCCGFDSIPSDLGVLMMQNEMQARHGVPCGEVKFVLAKMRGGFSGGTAASGLHLAEEAARDPAIRRTLGDPYSLDPDREEPGPDGPDQRGPRWDDDVGAWTGPFIMAAINTRIVRRSNALLGYAWGKDFRYSECAQFSPGTRGWLGAAGMTAGLAAFAVLSSQRTARRLLARALPAPGEGPSKAVRDAGFFEVKLFGRPASRASGGALVGTVRGTSDPGYGETAKMLGEAAVCLAKDDLPSPGGVLTPASCLGVTLLARLRRAGMTFDVAPLAGPTG